MNFWSVLRLPGAMIHDVMLASALVVSLALVVAGSACSNRVAGLPTPTVGPAPSPAAEGAPVGVGEAGTGSAATDPATTAAPLFHYLGATDALVTVVEFADFQ